MRFTFFLIAVFSSVILSAAPLKLAENGKTDYTIVVPSNASAVDQFAAKELAFFLKEITGAVFPIANTAKVLLFISEFPRGKICPMMSA